VKEVEYKGKQSGLEVEAGLQLPGKGLEGVLGNAQGLGPTRGASYDDLMKLIAGLVMYALSVYGTMAYAQGFNDARYGGKDGKDVYAAQPMYGAKSVGGKEGAKPEGVSHKSPNAQAYQRTE
jgi:hypothetical protein